MAKKVNISKEQVKKNIENLQAFMSKENLDYFYISSFDNFLNEYVPMSDCHRFYVTGFSGSVAETLVPKSGKVKLYVDGRYHEQADLEVDLNIVEVVKVPANTSLSSAMISDVESISPKTLGIESQRTSLNTFKKLSSLSKVTSYLNELNEVIDFAITPKFSPIKFIDKKYRGSDTSEKLKKILGDSDDAYFVTSIDSLSWVTNCRGYHLPNLSSFLGTALVTKDKAFVFVDKSIDLDDSVSQAKSVEFIKFSPEEFEKTIDYISLNNKIDNVFIDPSMTNAALYQSLINVFGDAKVVEKEGGLVNYHSVKEDAEIVEMKRGFNLADTAIYNTINWVKDSIKAGKEITELDLYNETTRKYEEQGSVEQSFNTIAGVGPNGSIMHYGDPKADIKIKADDMILLDSGGYFDGGFATDTTRTFMASDAKPTDKHKKIYTLVLKGMLQCQHAIFPEGTKGMVLDGFARKPIFDEGMNYAHGTGHGVGIHVHEGGVRIGASTLPVKERQIVSIEPGIYLPGFGGVRLENIALVVKDENNPGFLKFEPIVYIGFEPSLINEDMLTAQEKNWLETYEAKCSELGRSFRN